MFCKKHVPERERERWENVVSSRCKADGCRAHPSFGQIGGSRHSAEFCQKHIPEAEREKWENVVSERCRADGCKAQPTFGQVGGSRNSAVFCKKHIPEAEREKWEARKTKKKKDHFKLTHTESTILC